MPSRYEIGRARNSSEATALHWIARASGVISDDLLAFEAELHGQLNPEERAPSVDMHMLLNELERQEKLEHYAPALIAQAAGRLSVTQDIYASCLRRVGADSGRQGVRYRAHDLNIIVERYHPAAIGAFPEGVETITYRDFAYATEEGGPLVTLYGDSGMIQAHVAASDNLSQLPAIVDLRTQ